MTYRPDLDLLERLLKSIGESIEPCKSKHLISGCGLTIVDNSTDESVKEQLVTLSGSMQSEYDITVNLQFAERNLGYGNAHNRAISPHKGNYHLVLNPDVVLERNALVQALEFMEQHKGVGLLTPYAMDGKGERLYLCKRYPTVLDLFLRGFVPPRLRVHLNKRLGHYEMQDLKADQVSTEIPIASGCFMLIRNDLLQEIGAFNAKFFLYFEDFDLSVRMGKVANIAYVPAVRITHYGGRAARKGSRHIYWFIRSAISFFDLHGWKLW